MILLENEFKNENVEFCVNKHVYFHQKLVLPEFWKKAKVWNIPGWDELGWKTYDPNSIPTFYHPEPQPTTPIVLVDISSYAYLK